MYGKRIRELRETLGMSQGQFADATKITQTTLSSYERERTQPPIEWIKFICNTYNVDAGWLLGLTDYHELIDETYDDFADLISMGFSPDEAHRIVKDKFNRFGDMVMRLNHDDQKKVEEYCKKLLLEQTKKETHERAASIANAVKVLIDV